MSIKRKWEDGPGPDDTWELHHLSFIVGWLQAKEVILCGWTTAAQSGVALGVGNNHWLFIRDGGSSIELVSRYGDGDLAQRISDEIEMLWRKGAQGNV